MSAPATSDGGGAASRSASPQVIVLDAGAAVVKLLSAAEQMELYSVCTKVVDAVRHSFCHLLTSAHSMFCSICVAVV
jgi:hypothetical protein